MKNIQIIVGSMLGNTEYVAEACEEALQALNKTATLHFSPNLTEIPTQNCFWLICCSTHGAGDYPDNIKPFIDQLEQCDQDLSTVYFSVIGVGDSSYDTYCQAAKNINNLLLSKGCISNIPLKLIDMSLDLDPEVIAKDWISANKDQLP
jgi:MioC protein